MLVNEQSVADIAGFQQTNGGFFGVSSSDSGTAYTLTLSASGAINGTERLADEGQNRNGVGIICLGEFSQAHKI